MDITDCLHGRAVEQARIAQEMEIFGWYLVAGWARSNARWMAEKTRLINMQRIEDRMGVHKEKSNAPNL